IIRRGVFALRTISMTFEKCGRQELSYRIWGLENSRQNRVLSLQALKFLVSTLLCTASQPRQSRLLVARSWDYGHLKTQPGQRTKGTMSQNKIASWRC